jgi:hypothetical protein
MSKAQLRLHHETYLCVKENDFRQRTCARGVFNYIRQGPRADFVDAI